MNSHQRRVYRRAMARKWGTWGPARPRDLLADLDAFCKVVMEQTRDVYPSDYLDERTARTVIDLARRSGFAPHDITYRHLDRPNSEVPRVVVLTCDTLPVCPSYRGPRLK